MAATDPKRRSEAARIAALWSWADTRDRSARTRPAREAELRRMETRVDPEGRMSPQERAKAAAAARSARMRQLAKKRWDAHRRKTAA